MGILSLDCSKRMQNCNCNFVQCTMRMLIVVEKPGLYFPLAGQVKSGQQSKRLSVAITKGIATPPHSKLKFNFPYKLLHNFLFKWKFVEKDEAAEEAGEAVGN